MFNQIRLPAVKRPSKNVLMFVLSIIMGSIGVFVSKQYLESQIAIYKEQNSHAETMVDVVVPNRAMMRGDIITNSDLSVRSMPLQYVDQHTVSSGNYETAIGQRLDFDIDEGRALLWAHLEGGISPTFSGTVPSGLRAMTVRVDEINSISGLLQPKDKIDLLFSHGSGENRQIYPLIENLNVIATGVQTLVDKSGSASTRSFNTITVQVSPSEAKHLALSQQVGKLTAILRNPDDESALNKEPITTDELLGKKQIKPRKVIRLAKEKISKTTAIEYIIGGS